MSHGHGRSRQSMQGPSLCLQALCRGGEQGGAGRAPEGSGVAEPVVPAQSTLPRQGVQEGRQFPELQNRGRARKIGFDLGG